MKLHKGSLYSPTTYQASPRKKPALVADCYDAVIIGGGMSGALTALSLLDRGLKVAIMDKKRVASGSTAANTGLLQYSNDIMLHELIEQIGEKDAVNFYRSCKISMENLKRVADRLSINPHFICRESIYYASDENDAERLRSRISHIEKA